MDDLTMIAQRQCIMFGHVPCCTNPWHVPVIRVCFSLSLSRSLSARVCLCVVCHVMCRPCQLDCVHDYVMWRPLLERWKRSVSNKCNVHEQIVVYQVPEICKVIPKVIFVRQFTAYSHSSLRRMAASCKQTFDSTVLHTMRIASLSIQPTPCTLSATPNSSADADTLPRLFFGWLILLQPDIRKLFVCFHARRLVFATASQQVIEIS